MADSVPLPLSYLAGAAVCFYGGTHLLWRGFGGHATAHPFLRGIILALPIILVAAWASAIGEPGKAIAILTSGALIMITLSLGIVAMSAPNGGVFAPSLKLVAPLSAAMLIIGFSGPLYLSHAVGVAAMAVILLWAHPRPSPLDRQPGRGSATVYALLLLALGTVAMSIAIGKLVNLPILPVLGPVVVPLTILGAIGLLVGDTHARAGDRAVDTIVATTMGLLGIGVPLVIVIAHAQFAASPASTQPVTQPAIVMPLQAWRIDTVLLTILSVMLLPVGFGRFTLGRLEGILLILACVFFMLVTVATAGA